MFIVRECVCNLKFKNLLFLCIFYKNYLFIVNWIEYYSVKEGFNYLFDVIIEVRRFVIKDFVVGSSIVIFGSVIVDGIKVKVIYREYDVVIYVFFVYFLL